MRLIILCLLAFGSAAPLAAQSVAFSHERGFHTVPFELVLTADAGTEIRYTLDGSVPTATSRLYAAPLPVADRTPAPNSLSTISDVSTSYAPWAAPRGQVFKGTVVRAAGFAAGERVTPVATRTFFVHPDGDNRYRLPVISLVTDSLHLFDHESGIYVNGKIYADWRAANPTATETGDTPTNFAQTGEAWERPLHIELFEDDGSLGFAQDAGVRMHGSWARAFRQKTWRLYAKNDYGPSWFDYQLFPDKDLTRYKRFILRNSGQDWTKTMLRDGFMQRLVQDLNFDTQFYRPVVVFVNGEFWGIHNIRDRYDDYYIETHYGVPRNQIDFLELDAVVQEGEATHYNEMIVFLRFNALNSPQRLAQLRTMMDTENYGEYAMSQIYFNNRDWPHNNIDYWRKRTSTYLPDAPYGHDGRWRWMMKDTDFGFGWNMGSDAWKHDMLGFALIATGDREWSTLILRSMLANPDYRTWFLTRFTDLLNTHFVAERVGAELEARVAHIEPHMAEHLDRWGYNNDRWATPRNTTDWQANLDLMRHFASVRADTLLGFINQRYNLGGKVRVSVERPDAAAGHILFNTVALTDSTPGVAAQGGTWEGTWFRNLDLTATAVPAPGWEFAGWTGTVVSEDATIVLRPTGTTLLVPVFVPTETGTETTRDEPGDSFALIGAYPNPFNPSTVIRYRLSENGPTRLAIHDLLGREVAVLADGWLPAGEHATRFEAAGLASGVYLVRLVAGGEIHTHRITLLR